MTRQRVTSRARESAGNVKRIPGKRVSRSRQVDPDLVRPSRRDLDIAQERVVTPTQNADD